MITLSADEAKQIFDRRGIPPAQRPKGDCVLLDSQRAESLEVFEAVNQSMSQIKKGEAIPFDEVFAILESKYNV